MWGGSPSIPGAIVAGLESSCGVEKTVRIPYWLRLSFGGGGLEELVLAYMVALIFLGLFRPQGLFGEKS